MVTAELAAALPVLVLLMLAGLSAVHVVDARVRCLDAAREIARAASRGDNPAAAQGRSDAPDGASVSVARSSDEVRVTVVALVHPLGPRLLAVTVRETAVAATEPRSASASIRGRGPPTLR